MSGCRFGVSPINYLDPEEGALGYPKDLCDQRRDLKKKRGEPEGSVRAECNIEREKERKGN